MLEQAQDLRSFLHEPLQRRTMEGFALAVDDEGVDLRGDLKPGPAAEGVEERSVIEQPARVLRYRRAQMVGAREFFMRGKVDVRGTEHARQHVQQQASGIQVESGKAQLARFVKGDGLQLGPDLGPTISFILTRKGEVGHGKADVLHRRRQLPANLQIADLAEELRGVLLQPHAGGGGSGSGQALRTGSDGLSSGFPERAFMLGISGFADVLNHSIDQPEDGARAPACDRGKPKPVGQRGVKFVAQQQHL